MNLPERTPTLPQWKALLGQALRFKRLACWTWTTEEDIFGVLDPATGETGYCCVMGSLGVVFGLIVYMGTEGLDGYKKLRSKKRPPGGIEGLLLHDGLSLIFEDGKYVQKEERAVIGQLGLNLEGKHAYPVFRNLKPGYLPWPITDAEAVYLTHVLTQAEDICIRIKEQRTFLDTPASGQYLVRVPEPKGKTIIWHDQWMKPAAVVSKPLSVHFDELRVQRLKSKNLKMQGIWEFDYAFTDLPILETGRPYFPSLLIVADHDSGFIFHTFMSSPDTYQPEFANSFIEGLEKTGFLPSEILVAHDEARLIVDPIAVRLGIKLTRVKSCTKANRARKEFVKFMANGR
jgi:hypothetical protein